MSVVKASRRGTVDKKPSSGKSGGWQSRYVILEMFEGGTAKISWYEDKKAADKGKKKGDFDLPPSVVVTSDGCAEGFMVTVDKNLLPLRHSLKEQQEMWMESIKAAAAGTLEPSPEEKARAAMQQTSMQDATRKRSATAAENAKIIVVKKKHGILGLTVSDGANGTGCTVISMSPGSQLSHAGLNVGEIIMSEGENMVASREALIQALNAAGPEDAIEMMTAFYSYKLLVDKSVTGPTVGVSLQNSGPSVTVAGMTDGSAALAAGLKIDDVVLSINGKVVTSWSEAVEEIKSAERWVEFVVKGENETTGKAVKKTLVERDPEADLATWATAQFEAEGVGAGAPGVKVTAVTGGSASETAGVAVGQVIYTINNMPVKSPDEVKEALLKTGLANGKGCYLIGPP